MKLSVQVIVHPDDDTDDAPAVREVFTLDRDDLAADTLGLQLAEAKDLLVAVQDTLVEHQVQAAVAAQTACPALREAARGTRTPAPSWCAACSVRCACPAPAGGTAPAARSRTRTFSPLAALLPERTTPELAYLQARFAGLVSYGITADLLGEMLPLGRRAARHRGAPPDPGRGPAPGGRTRRRAAQLHRHLPARPGGAAPPGPAAGRRPGRRLRPLQPAALPHATAGSR